MNNNVSEELEADIRKLIDKFDTMSHNDITMSIQNLFIKHLHLEEYDFQLDKHNLFNIVNNARGAYNDLPTKVSIPIFKDRIILGYKEVKSKSITHSYKPGIGFFKYPPA